MYYWTHSEVPASVPQTPGRLSMISWPPTTPTTAELQFNISNEITSSTRTTEEDLYSPEPRPSDMRKSSAKDVEILSLEEEVKRLKQEVEKYKTLINIQSLTAKTVKDFSSPVEENKTLCVKTCDISLQTENSFSKVSEGLAEQSEEEKIGSVDKIKTKYEEKSTDTTDLAFENCVSLSNELICSSTQTETTVDNKGKIPALRNTLFLVNRNFCQLYLQILFS